MFQSSATRVRAWLSRFDDVLGDPADDAWLLEGDSWEPERDDVFEHPHRRPLRWDRERRGGSVPARPAHCISPVRGTPDPSRLDAAGRS